MRLTEILCCVSVSHSDMPVGRITRLDIQDMEVREQLKELRAYNRRTDDGPELFEDTEPVPQEVDRVRKTGNFF